MIQSSKHIRGLSVNFGATMTEYAILFGLVGVVSIVGLKALGISTYNLLAHTDVAKSDTLSLLKPIAPGNSVPGQAATNSAAERSLYNVAIDPATGKMSLQLGNTGGNVATNVTSNDGKTLNTLGSTMIANQLAQLAQAQTDPALKDYYTQLAQVSFYLGGAEGVLDKIPALTPASSRQYTNADALHDVVTLSGQLKTLIANPPSSLDQASSKEVLPLAADVFNIANQYKTSLNQFIVQDSQTGAVEVMSFAGKTEVHRPENFIQTLAAIFGFPPTTTTPPNSTGNGTPGSALTSQKNVPGDPQETYTSYSSLVSYDQIKSTAGTVLQANHVKSAAVQSTLTDANAIDQKGTVVKLVAGN